MLTNAVGVSERQRVQKGDAGDSTRIRRTNYKANLSQVANVKPLLVQVTSKRSMMVVIREEQNCGRLFDEPCHQ